VDWINLAQDGGNWPNLVNTAMKIGFPKMRGFSCLSEELLAS
jgi:hypothetical protein